MSATRSDGGAKQPAPFCLEDWRWPDGKKWREYRERLTLKGEDAPKGALHDR